jgi:hypothetical protein
MNKFLVFVVFLTFPFLSWADFVVVVNKQNGNMLQESDVRKLYLGQMTTFPNGEKAEPLMLIEGSAVRQHFLKKILQTTESRYISIWAKLLFTGNGTPPTEFKDYNEVLAYLLKNPMAIGYFPRSEMDPRLRIITDFDSVQVKD